MSKDLMVINTCSIIRVPALQAFSAMTVDTHKIHITDFSCWKRTLVSSTMAAPVSPTAPVAITLQSVTLTISVEGALMLSPYLLVSPDAPTHVASRVEAAVLASRHRKAKCYTQDASGCLRLELAGSNLIPQTLLTLYLAFFTDVMRHCDYKLAQVVPSFDSSTKPAFGMLFVPRQEGSP